MAVTGRVEFSGPFFERDPRKTVRANIRDMMDALAAEAASDVQMQVSSKSRVVAQATRGYTTSAKTGRRWELAMAVNALSEGMGKDEAVALKARIYGRRNGEHGTTRGIEQRFHPFSRTARAIRRMRAVLGANLTRGLE